MILKKTYDVETHNRTGMPTWAKLGQTCYYNFPNSKNVKCSVVQWKQLLYYVINMTLTIKRIATL